MNTRRFPGAFFALLSCILLAGCNSFDLKTRHQINSSSDTASTKAAPTQKPPEPETTSQKFTQEFLTDFCQKEMLQFPGPYDKKQLNAACEQVQVLDGCESVNGDPIVHYNRASGQPAKAKRVLVISMIHGDEVPAGSVSRAWMSRLENIEPRNHWRLIPLANPDGTKLRTRMNANGVDVNRNFPSKDWNELALQYWKTRQHSNPRRYPGPSPASEIETRCLMKHLHEYKPDFVISVHTPLGVLDFDGPKVKNPNFRPLPWVSLGNFPGSLGRYMWMDRKIPVLTIELKGSEGLRKLEEFDKLQDITGTIAIQADKLLQDENH